jgi:glycosyltransferase involved in cell wall biosynthesis
MRVLFLTIMDENYSRTWTYYSSLKNIGVDCRYIKINPGSIFRDLRFAKRNNQNLRLVIVIGSASQLLTVPAVLFFRQKVFLDAGWSLFESTMVNSQRRGVLWKNVVKSYMIDFFASRFSTKIFLESDNQAKWYRRIFLTKRKKCVTLYTGLDEIDFLPMKSEVGTKDKPFTVVFRGKDNDEAGLEVLAKATHMLCNQDINFVVLSQLKGGRAHFSSRTRVINEYFTSKGELAGFLAQADLSLGQLSNHKRLRRTIPHKAYESAYLGVPYLTARNKGILEIFKEDEEVFCFDPGSAEDLAKKISFLSVNKGLLENSAGNIRFKYERELSQKLLGKKFLEELGLGGI